MSRSLVYVFALALVAGCARSDNDAVSADQEIISVEEIEQTQQYIPPARAGADAAGGAPAPVVPVAQLPTALPDSTLRRRLLRTADVGLVVDDVEAMRREVAALTRRAGGFVSAEEETRYGERTEVRFTLRVPAARFDVVLDALTADGDAVAHRNVRVEDVTEQVADLEARLRARRAVRDRYLQLLASADEVGEILAVEAKVAETQEAIEVAEGQLRTLADRVTLATLNVTVSDEAPGVLAGAEPFGRRLGEAFAAGLAGLAELALGVVVLWPVWLLGVALVLGLRPVLRRRRVRPVVPVPAPGA